MEKTLAFPDTSIDRRAWELAKIALGADTPQKEIIARAQQIKDVLKSGGPLVAHICEVIR
jgi:hypothetical protein